MTFYRRNLPHLQRDAKPHFITFVTKKRWVLPEWARAIVLDGCRHDDGIRYKLHVAVVMPDHVHVILTPLIDPARELVVSLAEIMKGIKGASAQAINRRLERGGTVWQEESFDRDCGRQKAWMGRLSTCLTIRCVGDWFEIGASIRGCGRRRG